MLLLAASAARAEDPSVQFGALRVERAEEGQAMGWRVTAPILSDGLVGRLCLMRFRLRQGDRQLEQTRRAAVSLAQWNETAFFKNASLAERFDAKQAIDVSFTLVDLVSQRELGTVTTTLPGTTSLVVDDVVVKHLGRVVFHGKVDLAATWARAQHEAGRVFHDRAHKLPRHPDGYWHEWVQPTEGLHGDGPQRLVVGSGGELYYTPDLHKSFVQLR
jgi:hypothetical protein